MESFNITSARQDLYNLVDKVNIDHKPIQILGKRGNGILISESDWSAIEETLYLNAIPGLTQKILDGDKENTDTMTLAEELEW